MVRIFTALSVVLFVVGGASLALTFYLWFGDWPEQAKATVEHLRSVAENDARGPDPLLPDPHSAPHVDLSGTWQAVIDVAGRGEFGGIAPMASEPRHPADLAEFYQGVVWYKRTFDYRPGEAERAYLYFGAANYLTRVYLNGQLLGGHEGGFTPFNFDVTDALVEGENLLVVKVDNRRDDQDIPTPITDWHNYGGLTREVLLVRLPETHVSRWELRLEGEPGDEIVGFVEVGGTATQARVAVGIPELGIAEEFRTDANGRVAFRLPAKPERWSPRNPRLYRVAISAGDHRIEDSIGFRTIATRGSEILLNGEPIFLRGISIHDESLDGGGRAHSFAHAEQTLELARELGCNFVRLAHYPHPDTMARTADRLGLLVWAELPVYWNVAFDREDTLALAKTMFSELIERDRNRASVVMWSLGNETPATEERDAFFTSLAAHVRDLDSSRLLTAAMLTGAEVLQPFLFDYYLPAVLGFVKDEWIFRIDDPLEEIVDVGAVNQYFGWYYSGALAAMTPLSSEYARQTVLDNMDRIRIETALDKPLIISELGAGAKYGLRAADGEMRMFSEDYQATVYQRQLSMLADQETVRGISPWILKDFRAPLRMYQSVQDYWNRKGLVSEVGERKLAFHVLRERYRELEAAP